MNTKESGDLLVSLGLLILQHPSREAKMLGGFWVFGGTLVECFLDAQRGD